MTDFFGPIVTGTAVAEAMIDHLKMWETTYLAETERKEGREARSLPRIKSWTTTPRSPDKWVDSQLPAVLVVNPGITAPPKSEGDGTYTATWGVGIAVICSARTEEETDAFAKSYFAAIRTILLHHPGLGDFGADKTTWQTEDYDQLPSESRRTMASGYGVFNVTVKNVGIAHLGLTEPPDDPYDVPDMPVVSETDLEVTKP